MNALAFADAARRIGAAAHAEGLIVPAFRSPPHLPGAPRTIRRYPGGVVVAVRIKDRDDSEWVADMVAGVLAANPGHDDAREALEAAIQPLCPVTP